MFNIRRGDLYHLSYKTFTNYLSILMNSYSDLLEESVNSVTLVELLILHRFF